MNTKLIQTDQVEIQDPTTDHLLADDYADENSFMPGFISFCQDAQLNQHETDQLYATNDFDLHDMDISTGDDTLLQLAKKFAR